MDIKASSQLPWWLLLGFVVFMTGLLMLAHRLAASLGWRELLDVGILFFSYGLVALWLRRNPFASKPDYLDRDKTTIIVIEPRIITGYEPRQIPAHSNAGSRVSTQPISLSSHR